jgi:uncharacterized membrane protein
LREFQKTLRRPSYDAAFSSTSINQLHRTLSEAINTNDPQIRYAVLHDYYNNPANARASFHRWLTEKFGEKSFVNTHSLVHKAYAERPY